MENTNALNQLEEHIIRIRETTKDDVINKLNEHNRCIIIRPTGWGKTWLLTEIISMYKSVLYLYPSEVIADTVRGRYKALFADSLDPDTIASINTLKSFGNVTMMTYMKLINLDDKDFANMDYDLIILDEAHRAGATRTSQAISRLIQKHPNTHLLGATATPNRMDAIDVTRMYFNDVTTYPYTVHDAIQDRMLPMPSYCYCTYDVPNDIKSKLKFDEALTAGQDDKAINEIVKEVLGRNIIEMAQIFGMPSIIRQVCEKHLDDTHYMKFIVFFANHSHMREKMPEVESWFKEAYPNHEIRTLKISSESTLASKNVKQLGSLTKTQNTIDLICCVDMLNMGYHVNDLSGILMYRSTNSNIIYVQQLGRVLSSGTDSKTVVFDVVDNLHRKAVYDINVKAKKTRKGGPGAKVETPWHVDGQNNIVDKYGNTAAIRIMNDGTIVNDEGNPTAMYVDKPTGKVYTTNEYNPWWQNDIDLGYNDFNHVNITGKLTANGKEATYEELVAKLVAEPESQRARSAIYLHLARFCTARNIPYPITQKELLEKYKIPISDFYDDFKELIKKNKLSYPYGDAQALLSLGDRSDNLEICARIKNVSIRTIMRLLRLKPDEPLTAPA